MRSIRESVVLGLAACSLAVLCPVPAQAQAAQPQTQPQKATPASPRGDVSAGIGWYCARTEPSGVYEHWYNDAASFDVQAGFYLTEHVKIEVGAAAAGEGHSWSGDSRITPSGAIEYLNREHFYHVRTGSAALVYQFRRNAWIHPFIGAGFDVDRQRERVWTRVYPASSTTLPPPPPRETETITTETIGAAFAVAGLKTYFSERVFFRADVKLGGVTNADKVVVRLGFGVDF